MQTDPNWSNFFYDPELHKVSTRWGSHRDPELHWTRAPRSGGLSPPLPCPSTLLGQTFPGIAVPRWLFWTSGQLGNLTDPSPTSTSR